MLLTTGFHSSDRYLSINLMTGLRSGLVFLNDGKLQILLKNVTLLCRTVRLSVRANLLLPGQRTF